MHYNDCKGTSWHHQNKTSYTTRSQPSCILPTFPQTKRAQPWHKKRGEGFSETDVPHLYNNVRVTAPVLGIEGGRLDSDTRVEFETRLN